MLPVGVVVAGVIVVDVVVVVVLVVDSVMPHSSNVGSCGPLIPLHLLSPDCKR